MVPRPSGSRLRRTRLCLEPLEERALPDAGLGPALPGPDSLFVSGLYRDLLHRAPSAAEVDDWLQTIAGGASHTAVAQTFLGSPEYRADQVRALYEKLLGREPEPGAIDDRLADLQNGATLEQITAEILSSDEFFAGHGGKAEAWVNAVYQVELGRPAQPDEQAAWAQVLQQDPDRTAVAARILSGSEYHQDVVAGLYHTLLQRAPDADGAAGWQALLATGSTEVEVAAPIAGSDEYVQLQVRLATAVATPQPFEPNVGQADSSVGFMAHGQGYDIYLTPTEVLAALNSGDSGTPVVITLDGANAAAQGSGRDLLDSTSNYFLGNDPSQWLTGVANYAQVGYDGVYPGIDAVYQRTQGQLEFLYVVHAGADPRAIRLSVTGGPATLAADGTLQITLPGSTTPLVIGAPQIYQNIGGVRVPVKGGWAMNADGTIGFQIDPYDATQDLVIDPALVYSTYFGGTANEIFTNGDDNDTTTQIVADAAGNLYAVGSTISTNFPVSGGAIQRQFRGTQDAVIVKLNPSGQRIYATYLSGTTGTTAGHGIATDTVGDAFVVGTTSASTFPTTTGVFQPVKNSGNDAFIVILNRNGALLASTFFGGPGSDVGGAIGMDAVGDIYIAGNTSSTSRIASAGAFQTTLAGGDDAYVAAFNPSLTARIFGTYVGGTSEDDAYSIGVTPGGDSFIAGETTSSNYPVRNAFQPTFGGGEDAFITRINAAGTALVYSSYFGGNGGDDEARGLAVDGLGNAYFTGVLNSANFAVTPGAFDSVGSSSVGAEPVVKVNADGTLGFFARLGATGAPSAGGAITVDSTGDVYVAGTTSSSNFPVTGDAIQPNLAGGQDATVAVLDPTGASLVFSTYLGGSATDTGRGMALDRNNNMFVSGLTGSANFPVMNAFQPALAGGQDFFFTEISAVVAPPSPTPPPAPIPIVVIPPAPPAPTRIFFPLRYIFDAATRTFDGNLTIVAGMTAPDNLLVVFTDLPQGVRVRNANARTRSGQQVITLGPVAAGDIVRVPIELTNPLQLPLSTFFIGFGVQTFAT